MNNKVFCAPHITGAVDIAIEKPDGSFVGLHSKETIEQLSISYPGVYIDTVASAIERQNAAVRLAPSEITREQFIEALGCLPPLDWFTIGTTSSFKMSEFYCGSMTSIYVCIQNRYFHLRDFFTLTHEEIVEKVKTDFPSN